MDELLSKVKANLILEHTADDALLKSRNMQCLS